MGTRADFYVGTGPTAEWLGSLAWDGNRIDGASKPELGERYYDDSAACWAIKSAANEAEYRAAVSRLLSLNDDATLPAQGWPWPWENSHTTDYAYAFVDGACKTFPWGKGVEWPDMSDRSNFTLGKRSGVIVVGG